ncbi:hypothetical protein JX266_002683 [Neoarthrinium moseri]|uniref:uncharacterized protein n=1 Tax=Neoarthrinium moseri TaxID=1658444 RepID=UPI001FDD76AB|nr:uncharacterized protein JN550_005121 [Neoarthrinium moseri]KAI1852505.1 hypothetical protein JX266_002683 [Neoarthrinium moseri]KAI1870578.1 hypothetical protein JN550_005121 [Neoarthrinium moseri]
MLLMDRALLFVVALLVHGLQPVTAEPHWGRFARRMLSDNQTIPATATSSNPTEAVSPSTSLSIPQSNSVLSSVATTISTSTNQLFTLEGLGSITALPRPSAPVTLIAGSSPTTSPTWQSSLISESQLEVSASSLVSSMLSSPTLFTSTIAAVNPLTTSSIPYPVNGTGSSLVPNSTVSPVYNITIVTYKPQSPVVTPQDDSTQNRDDGITTDNPQSCVATNPGASTIWSTIHTWTTTWTGPPSDYTAPFPAPTTPPVCSQTTGRLSVSVCGGSGETCSQYTYPSTGDGDGNRRPPPTATEVTSTIAATSTKVRGAPSTITFYTTDKNPVVVFSSEKPPNYGSGGTTMVQDHNTPDGDDNPTGIPEYGRLSSPRPPPVTTSTPEAVKQSPTSSTAVTVIIQTTQVIINGETFTDSPQSKTSTVVVGTDTFVIDPSQVIGAGATVTRPASGAIFIPTSTTTTIGGLQVVYGATVATIDGTVFTVGSTPSTAVVQGQVITLGPGGIAFPSATIPIIKAAGVTEAAVLGGELLTAIGNSLVVVEGTTFTYGPGSGVTTKVVDGDTILIGPTGVSVHGVTLGGPTAAPTATTYEIVGGATITEIGGSAVVIDGTTFAIGTWATTAITTVIDGQTLTIGPSGVGSASYTFAQPYATSTVILPRGTSALPAATETSNDAGSFFRPHGSTQIIGICIAIGVGFLVGLLC